MNLDDASYTRRFDRAFRDSGAIIVGAGTRQAVVHHMFGRMQAAGVDVQGWGDSVIDLGEWMPDQRVRVHAGSNASKQRC